MPLTLCSCSRLVNASCGMTLETNEELLLTILFFGLFLLLGSLETLPFTTSSAALSAPNTGVRRPSNGDDTKPFTPWDSASLVWLLDSCSAMGGTCDRVLFLVSSLDSS